MKARILGLILTMAIATGCANLMTVDRRSHLPGQGKAIHLDAPQRLVFSNSAGRICAEPSPDALQAYAASQGLGVSIPSQGAGSFANAVQASSASIGLHTQSITLMRDALFRICEAAYNSSLADGDVMQLLERSQDMTLGILAIEQLTGAVAARQVILTGTANASASANLANTQATLDSVRMAEQSKKAARDDAQAAVDRDSKDVDQATKDLDVAQKASPVVPADVKRATENLAAKQKQLETDTATLQGAKDEHVAAQKVTQAVGQNLNAAITSASAVATGTGQFSTGTDRANIDKDTVEKIADATKYIVQRIIDKGHVTDSCMNLFSRYALVDDPKKQAALKPIFTQCEIVMKAYLEAYAKSLGAGGPAPAPSPAPAPAPAPAAKPNVVPQPLPTPPTSR